jgi:hypothetical protein
MTVSEVRQVNYRRLMRRVEQVVASLDRHEDMGTTIHSLIDTIVDKLRDELGLFGGRLYERRNGDYVLDGTFGDAKSVPGGL